jgi:hypothetical protein
MQLLEGDLFSRFPTLRFIIPHGGGAVPYHWGRYRGLADMLKKPALDGHLMNNVFFDTCVYHQPGVNLLAEVIETKNILFGSEMVGACAASIPDRALFRRHQALCRCAGHHARAAPRDLRGQCPPRVPAPGRKLKERGL